MSDIIDNNDDDIDATGGRTRSGRVFGSRTPEFGETPVIDDEGVAVALQQRLDSGLDDGHIMNRTFPLDTDTLERMDGVGHFGAPHPSVFEIPPHLLVLRLSPPNFPTYQPPVPLLWLPLLYRIFPSPRFRVWLNPEFLEFHLNRSICRLHMNFPPRCPTNPTIPHILHTRFLFPKFSLILTRPLPFTRHLLPTFPTKLCLPVPTTQRLALILIR